jgi:hypothetical protein
MNKSIILLLLQVVFSISMVSITACVSGKLESYVMTSDDPSQWVELEKMVANSSVTADNIKDQWGQYASLPLRTKTFSGVTMLADGRLFFCGGRPDARLLKGSRSEVQVYDPTDGRTETMTPMPRDAHIMQAVLMEGGRVFVGGDKRLGGFYVFDPSTNQWATFIDKSPTEKLKVFPLEDGRVGLLDQRAWRLKIWDPRTNNPIDSGCNMVGMAFPFPDGDVLLWDPRTGDAKRWRATSQTTEDLTSAMRKVFTKTRGSIQNDYILLDLDAESVLLLPQHSQGRFTTYIWNVNSEQLSDVGRPPLPNGRDAKIVCFGNGMHLIIKPQPGVAPDRALASFAILDTSKSRWDSLEVKTAIRYSGNYFHKGMGEFVVAGGEFYMGRDYAFPFVRTLKLRSKQ